MTTISLIHVTNPFRHSVDKVEREYNRPYRVLTMLRKAGVVVGKGKDYTRVGQFVAVLNNEPVLERDWGKVTCRDGDVLVVLTLPQGGDGSNPLQIVMMVAIMVAAAYTGGAAAGAFGSQMAGGLAAAAVTLAGTLLMNVMFPPPKPNMGNVGQAASPNYSLSAQGNQARLGQAIPRVYGRMRVFPDYAAKPYTEYVGKDQFLYQLYLVSQGDVDIEQMRVAESELSSFGEIQYEVIKPGGRVTLFPDNVTVSVEVQGLEMRAPNQTGVQALGPFPTNAPGTLVEHIGVDLSLPQGVFRLSNQGETKDYQVSYHFQYRQIDDLGNPLGTWQVLESSSLTLATRDAQNFSFKKAVTPGRYEVQAWRTSNVTDDGKHGEVMLWNGMRGYGANIGSYGNYTMVATVYKATETLNQQTQRAFNVICTGKTRTWDPVNGFSLEAVPNRSPAWAILDMCTDTSYGRGLAPSRVNLNTLYRLSQVWAARGDTFNGVFDTTLQFWDALRTVAAVGRAVPVYNAGLVDFVRAEPKSVVNHVFTPAHMVRGSFSTVYQFAEPDTPDHIVMEFVDETTWKESSVTCVLPGSEARNPSRLKMIGITNRDQAWREGMSRAAANRDQRRRISFQSRKGGLVPAFGDLCRLNHDVPAWGASGKVRTFDRGTGILELTEPLKFGVGLHYISFRKRNGAEDGPYEIAQSPDGNPKRAVLVNTTQAQRNAIWISDGVTTDYTTYIFGPGERRGLLALMHSAAPEESGSVSLSFVNYAESVHTAETGGVVPPPGPESELPGAPVAPVVDWVRVEYLPTIGQQQVVASPASGAIYYEFQASSNNGVNWQQLGQSPTPSIFTTLSAGPWIVRCRGVGRAAGPWAHWSGNLEMTTLPVPQVSAFTALGKMMEIELRWVYSPNNVNIVESVEIWGGTVNNIGLANKLATLPYPADNFTVSNLGPGDTLYFWIRVKDNAGRLSNWFNGGTATVATTTNDAGLILEYLAGKITDTQLSQELLSQIEGGGGAMIEVQQIKNDLAAMYTIKTQLSVGGRTVLAGIGVGVENNQGILESQVLVYANRFAILTDQGDGGVPKVPFVVDNGVVYMNAAFIKDGTITNAKIGNYIQSDNYIPGQRGWRIDKAGGFEINGVSASGRTLITAGLVQVWDANGVLRGRFGIW